MTPRAQTLLAERPADDAQREAFAAAVLKGLAAPLIRLSMAIPGPLLLAT